MVLERLVVSVGSTVNRGTHCTGDGAGCNDRMRRACRGLISCCCCCCCCCSGWGCCCCCCCSGWGCCDCNSGCSGRGGSGAAAAVCFWVSCSCKPATWGARPAWPGPVCTAGRNCGIGSAARAAWGALANAAAASRCSISSATTAAAANSGRFSEGSAVSCRRSSSSSRLADASMTAAAAAAAASASANMACTAESDTGGGSACAAAGAEAGAVPAGPPGAANM